MLKLEQDYEDDRAQQLFSVFRVLSRISGALSVVFVVVFTAFPWVTFALGVLIVGCLAALALLGKRMAAVGARVRWTQGG